VRVWPVTVGVAARTGAAAPTGDAEAYAAAAATARRLGDADPRAYYTTEVLGDDPAAPGFHAIDFRRTVDGVLWAAVLGTPETDAAALGGAVLNLGFVPDPEVPSMDEVDACRGTGGPEGTDEVVWEVSTGEMRGDDPVYHALTVVGDTTGGLARQGVVRLRLPRDPRVPGIPVPVVPTLAGTGSLPPLLDDEALEDELIFWIRAYRRRRDRRIGGVAWLGANATRILQVTTARAELLGTGTGGAGQTYRLVHAPVVAGSLVLEVEAPGGWTRWTEVDDFLAAGRDDRVFVLDREAAEVRFGDGTRGKPPRIGERIRAVEYRHGGGAQGNLPAGAVTRVSAAGVKGGNPLPTRDGADAEAVKDAVERIPAELRRRDRAVTADDFRELALATPGVEVGRAEVLPRFAPRDRVRDAAGVVTVVVWPASDAARPNAPRPDRDLLRCVCEWLDARRLVTTELYVVPPTYRKVSVAVGVAVKPGFGVEAVRAWVELVIRQYLAPLPPYGPSGAGWPLGRRVHGPELEAAALQVEGVEFLERLRVAGWRPGAGGAEGRWEEGTVLLDPWEVPELTEITVVEGEPLAPGESLAPPPPRRAGPDGSDGDDEAAMPVPIPTLREEC
jgi:hypothetical protein